MYTVLVPLAVTLILPLFGGSLAEVQRMLADAIATAGVALMFTLAAPLLALIATPVLAATAVFACLISSHFLATRTWASSQARRLTAVGCGMLTGVALWAASLWAGGTKFAIVGGLWVVPAILAMLTVDRFLFAPRAQRGYRNL